MAASKIRAFVDLTKALTGIDLTEGVEIAFDSETLNVKLDPEAAEFILGGKGGSRIPSNEPTPQDWMKVLGFESEAEVTHDAIRKRQRELSKRYHPDRKGGSHEKQQEVNMAAQAAKEWLDS